MTSQQEMNTTGLSIVLGTYNRKPFLKLAVESIREELLKASFPHEIIVIDGGSTDGTLLWLSQQKDIITIIQHNHGTWKGKEIERRSWGYFMNLGFRATQGKYICMLSDDCLVIPGAIINGYQTFEKESENGRPVGVVCFYFRDWPDYPHFFISVAPNNILLLNHGMFSKKALEDVEYIDEDHFVFYHADSDLCLRIQEKGYRIIKSPESFIEHYSHANVSIRRSNTAKMDDDWKTFYNRWKIPLGLTSEINKDIWMRKDNYQSKECAIHKVQKSGGCSNFSFIISESFRIRNHFLFLIRTFRIKALYMIPLFLLDYTGKMILYIISGKLWK